MFKTPSTIAKIIADEKPSKCNFLIVMGCKEQKPFHFDEKNFFKSFI